MRTLMAGWLTCSGHLDDLLDLIRSLTTEVADSRRYYPPMLVVPRLAETPDPYPRDELPD
jgi:hypothetical protein